MQLRPSFESADTDAVFYNGLVMHLIAVGYIPAPH